MNVICMRFIVVSSVSVTVFKSGLTGQLIGDFVECTYVYMEPFNLSIVVRQGMNALRIWSRDTNEVFIYTLPFIGVINQDVYENINRE